MKHIRKNDRAWKYARLRILLIVFFLLFSMFPLFILGVGVFLSAQKEFAVQAREHFLQSAVSTGEILDNQLDYIEEFSLKMNADEKLYEIFQNINSQDAAELSWASDQIAQIFLNYLPWDNEVYSAHLVTSYYRFGEENKNFYPTNAFIHSEMVEKAEKAGGKLVWIPTYDYEKMFQVKGLEHVETDYKRMFSAVRKLYPCKISLGRIMKLNPQIESPYLVVNFTEETFRNMLEKYVQGNSKGEYYVATVEGELVSCIQGGENQSFPYMVRELEKLDKQSGSRRIKVEEEDYIMAYAKSQVTGWYVIAAIPVRALSQEFAGTLRNMILLLSFVAAILTGVASWFLSKNINKKIYKPLQMIEKVGGGDFSSEISYDTKDEFAFFYQKLNEMNKNLKKLVHENYEVKLEKKDTEIMALNIQMNPHFLYNSLNIINWLCLRGEKEKTSRMLVDLSRMLQYTSKNRELMVPLQEDLVWLERYIDIMSFRYQHRFFVNLEIPQEYLELQIPKLFLQPFVENAIVHGFKDYQVDGEILITAEAEEKDIIFCVEDNGCGISQEKIEKIFSQKSNSIGIINTQKRLQMLFGEKSGVFISSQVGEGTRVFIKISREKMGPSI